MKKYLELAQLNEHEILYHYTKCHAVENIFRSHVLFATKSSFLNDTHEMAYILHISQEVIDEMPEKSWRSLMLRQVVDTMEDFKRHDIFVLSFSEERDAITLWAEFGEETGYNLGFDGEELLRTIGDRQKIYCHGRVIYDHQKQLNLIRGLVRTEIPQKSGGSFETIMQNEIDHPGTAAFQKYRRRLQAALNVYATFFKQEEFQAEKEYRIVFKNPDKSRILFREKDGFLLPYIQVDLGKKQLLPVKSITVAPKNHVDLARKGMRQYVELLGYDIPVDLSNLKLRY